MKQIKFKNSQINLRNKFLKFGVKMVGPETIFFSEDTKLGKNVIIEPYVVFGPKVKIGDNVTIKSFSHLENCKVENKVDIGPYARVRPGSILKEGSKIGNFVEIKKSTLGKKSRHELYFELLTPEMIQEEKDLDRQFYLKRNQWNAAISKYRNKYYREIYGDVR